MGYFKRKIDRARSRELIRGLHEDAAERADWMPWDGERWSALDRVRYVRFSIPERDDWSGRRTGVFHAAYRLRRTTRLEGEVLESLDRAMTWFGENLPAPELDEGRAIFFFKSSSESCISRIWELIWILREHDRHVELQWVDQPGRIVYEDDHQVAAIPWRLAREL